MGAWLSKAAAAPSSPWSALPPEILDLVLRRLPSHADRLRLAYVCRHWLRATAMYSAPRLPRALPWLNLRDGSFRTLPDGERHSFHHLLFRGRARRLCWGCSGHWLLFREPWRRSPGRRTLLKNPLRGTTMRLPDLCSDDPIVYDLINNPDGSQHGTRPSSKSTEFFLGKVIVCSEQLVAARVVYYDLGLHAVACCRPSTSSPSWSAGPCDGHTYEDMAFYNGKLYTVTADGDLFAHVVTDDMATGGEPMVSRADHLIQATPELKPTLDGSSYAALNCYITCYLVISRGRKLLMVRRIVPEDPTLEMILKVFEADMEMSRWLEVGRMEDEVLFVSSYCSRAFSASSYYYLQGNQIYFLDDSITYWVLGIPSNRPACGVYDMGTNTVRPIVLGKSHISLQSQASWFFP